jgi:glyoxylase-like metal-dependent hydrolase (beta-lactamase superfamily II)/rhodanese-related sulfurtransferase
MEFQQFYLACLAHASYLIGSDGQAAVVDPRRDVDEYIDEAKTRGLAIKFVIETHLHADFVSGYRELVERTGAAVVFGAKAEATFPHRAVREGDEIRLGKVILRVLETPGHTPESISLVVIDTAEGPEPRMVLTGDTLFIGDVGRPDLAGKGGVSAEAMAGMLYDSLHEKLLKLPDPVEVYPAHGAGSLCGRNISKETSSTIGEQRRTNYALRPMPRADFVKMMTVDLPEVPAYFPVDVQKNREGAPALGSRPRPAALGPARVRALGEGVSLLDVRPAAAFGTGHVPGSINIGLAGQFASWAGTLLSPDRPLVIVAEDEGQVDEAALRLSRVGLENVAGYLEGGVAAWDRAGLALATVPQITVDELRALLQENPGLQVVDVRRPPEFGSGHVPRALARPLDRLEREMDGLDPARPTAVVCAGGYRSSAGTSLLRRHGFLELRNVVGGTSAWTAAGYPTEP